MILYRSKKLGEPTHQDRILDAPAGRHHFDDGLNVPRECVGDRAGDELGEAGNEVGVYAAVPGRRAGHEVFAVHLETRRFGWQPGEEGVGVQ